MIPSQAVEWGAAATVGVLVAFVAMALSGPVTRGIRRLVPQLAPWRARRAAKKLAVHPLTTQAVELLWSRIASEIEDHRTLERARDQRSRITRVARVLPPSAALGGEGIEQLKRRGSLGAESYGSPVPFESCAGGSFVLRFRAQRPCTIVGYDIAADLSAWICESVKVGDEEQTLCGKCSLVAGCESLIGNSQIRSGLDVQITITAPHRTSFPLVALLAECAR